MNKLFWIPLMFSFGTMIVLYLIGYLFDVDFLTLKISFSYSEIAFLPIVLGLLVGFISERIIKYKSS
ncbi:ATPase [Robertmurraya massiliosenegalensis]|uniref:ATPase n=1 Tax=Robertmurraya TaxID=2837507 RepID=UPI0039A72ECC